MKIKLRIRINPDCGVAGVWSGGCLALADWWLMFAIILIYAPAFTWDALTKLLYALLDANCDYREITGILKNLRDFHHLFGDGGELTIADFQRSSCARHSDGSSLDPDLLRQFTQEADFLEEICITA